MCGPAARDAGLWNWRVAIPTQLGARAPCRTAQPPLQATAPNHSGTPRDIKQPFRVRLSTTPHAIAPALRLLPRSRRQYAAEGRGLFDLEIV